MFEEIYNANCRMFTFSVGTGIISIHHAHMLDLIANWGLVRFLKGAYTRNINLMGYEDGKLLIIDGDGNEFNFTKWELEKIVANVLIK